MRAAAAWMSKKVGADVVEDFLKTAKACEGQPREAGAWFEMPTGGKQPQAAMVLEIFPQEHILLG
jgi:hypothetical protein